MKKAYVAARVTRRREAREIMDILRALGYEITLDWTTKGYLPSSEAELEAFRKEHYGPHTPEVAAEFQQTWNAVLDANLFVILGDATGSTMYGLLGVALTAKQFTAKPQRICGIDTEDRNLLCQHPEIQHFPNLGAFTEYLRKEAA